MTGSGLLASEAPLLVSVEAMARRLGITSEEAVYLVARGIVPSLVVPGTNQRRVVFTHLRPWLADLIRDRIEAERNTAANWPRNGLTITSP